MKIALGSDHGGYEAKKKVIEHLKEKNIECIDVGTHSKDSCNYAEFGIAAAKLVSSKEADLGIVICNSGEGIAIAANKVKGIRCAILYNDEVAHLAKEHNDANMIAFGAQFMKVEDILKRIDIFLASSFEGGRHSLRIKTITDEEN